MTTFHNWETKFSKAIRQGETVSVGDRFVDFWVWCLLEIFDFWYRTKKNPKFFSIFFFFLNCSKMDFKCFLGVRKIVRPPLLYFFFVQNVLENFQKTWKKRRKFGEDIFSLDQYEYFCTETQFEKVFSFSNKKNKKSNFFFLGNIFLRCQTLGHFRHFWVIFEDFYILKKKWRHFDPQKTLIEKPGTFFDL